MSELPSGGWKQSSLDSAGVKVDVGPRGVWGTQHRALLSDNGGQEGNKSKAGKCGVWLLYTSVAAY